MEPPNTEEEEEEQRPCLFLAPSEPQQQQQEETPGEVTQRLKQRKRGRPSRAPEMKEEKTHHKTIRTGETGGRQLVEDETTTPQKEEAATQEETTIPTIRELIWNRKEHLVGFLRKILPARAQSYAQWVQETPVEDWVIQFQTYVIPLYRLGLMRVVIQKIMDKVGVRMEELGRDPQEARTHYQHFTTYMTTFARLIQMLPQ
jgi:hypothetical protein